MCVPIFLWCLGTKVDFTFPDLTDDDDGDDVDSCVSKLSDEHLPEATCSNGSNFDVTNNFDAPADAEKSCFDFYG